MTDDRLQWHLDNWASWHMARGQSLGGGYPTRASGGVRSIASQDFDTMVEAADIHCAEAVEAILDGCTVVQRCAVHHFHLGAVFRFPRPGLGAEIAYRAAREAVRAGLVRRGIP